MLQSRMSTGRRSIYVFVIAAVISLIGAVLGVGGGWLAALGGSWYYLIAGISLVASGVLFFMHRRSGVFLYAVIVAATAIWAFAEAGLDGWALVPRLVAPLVLFAFVTRFALRTGIAILSGRRACMSERSGFRM